MSFLSPFCQKLTRAAFQQSAALQKGKAEAPSVAQHPREVQTHSRHLGLVHCLSSEAFCPSFPGTVAVVCWLWS
ncbi:Uncharacterised protein [Chlamydia abortus]|nr:Uncharacterised protein [Chlamydia abortus]